MSKPTTSRALIAEPPLLVLPSLACAVGLNQAIVLQQLHFLSQIRKPDRQGLRWIALGGGDLEHTFPFWSRSTIWRAVWQMRDAGLLVINPDAGEANSYRINYQAIAAAVDKVVENPPEPGDHHVQIEHSGEEESAANPVQNEHTTLSKLNRATTKELLREELYTKGGKKKAEARTPEPCAMHPLWIPHEGTREEIRALGIPDAFIDQVLPEFRAYWIERGAFRCWGATFLAHCRRQHRKPPAKPAHDMGTKPPTKPRPFFRAADQPKRDLGDPAVGKAALEALSKQLRISR